LAGAGIAWLSIKLFGIRVLSLWFKKRLFATTAAVLCPDVRADLS
jgi:hypothetical protein